jgi:hypothetical protein
LREIEEVTTTFHRDMYRLAVHSHQGISNKKKRAQYNCFNISGKQGQLKGNNAGAAAKGPGLI